VNSAFSELAANTLLVVGALFPIVNPLGNAPIFLTLTRGLSGRGRTKLEWAIAVNGLVLMVVSTGWALLRHSDDEEAPRKPKALQRGELHAAGFLSVDAAIDCGPGFDRGGGQPDRAEWRWPLIAGLLIGALVIAVSIYLSYRFAEKIAAALGDAAMNVVVRLSSFILVCIGVQISRNGLSALLRSVLVR